MKTRREKTLSHEYQSTVLDTSHYIELSSHCSSPTDIAYDELVDMYCNFTVQVATPYVARILLWHSLLTMITEYVHLARCHIVIRSTVRFHAATSSKCSLDSK